MGLVVVRFQYARSAIARQLLDDDLNRIDIVYSKAFKWQLTPILPSLVDIVHNADQQRILAVFNPIHCLNHMLPKKNMYGRNLRANGHGLVLPKVITDRHKNISLLRCLYHR